VGGLCSFLLVLIGVNALIVLFAFVVVALVPVLYSLVLYKRLERQGKLGGKV